jgi:hypothetical protein
VTPEREDRETTTVEAAAEFERREREWPTVRISGQRVDPDELPARWEL